MSTTKMSDDEKKWRAESDAETMARYEEIMNDKSRRDAAVKVARERANELTKRANAMNNVANSSTTKSTKTTTKTTKSSKKK